MLQILLFISAFILIIWAPIECRKVINGWKNPRFKGAPEEYRRTYRKQINIFRWVALVVGALDVGMAFVDQPDTAHMAVQLALGALWLAAGGVMFYCVHLLDTRPAVMPQPVAAPAEPLTIIAPPDES